MIVNNFLKLYCTFYVKVHYICNALIKQFVCICIAIILQFMNSKQQLKLMYGDLARIVKESGYSRNYCAAFFKSPAKSTIPIEAQDKILAAYEKVVKERNLKTRAIQKRIKALAS